MHGLLGGDLVRAEEGKLRFRSRNGDFEMYMGLVPENVFGHLRERLLVLEALFMKVPAFLDREKGALLNALVHEFSTCVEIVDGKRNCKKVWDKLVEMGGRNPEGDGARGRPTGRREPMCSLRPDRTTAPR